MSSIQPAQHKSPLVPSLFKTIRSGYSLGMLSKDVSAGITVGVVALPLALAFAIASGLTPERGLYTSIIAGFFMAFFSGSRFPVSGPTGAFVVIIYSIVSRHGYEGLVLTTLMAGILLVIFGFLRLGALVTDIPYPVTTGFTTGIALLIFSSQMKDFFGLPLVDTPPEFFDKWGAYAQNAMDFSPATFGVAVFTLLVILIVRHKIPKVPAPVVAVFPVHAAGVAVLPAYRYHRFPVSARCPLASRISLCQYRDHLRAYPRAVPRRADHRPAGGHRIAAGLCGGGQHDGRQAQFEYGADFAGYRQRGLGVLRRFRRRGRHCPHGDQRARRCAFVHLRHRALPVPRRGGHVASAVDRIHPAGGPRRRAGHGRL